MAKEYKKFPVIQTNPPEYVPWDMLVAHEERVNRNHAQSLEVLASRGGLSWGEILVILEDKPWSRICGNQKEKKEAVMGYVSSYLEGCDGNG